MSDRPAAYDRVSKWLHWSTALLLLAGFLIGENTSHHFADWPGYGFHVSIGIAILVLTIWRIWWRLTHRAPAYPATMSSLERTAANIMKLVFYGLLIVLPLSGLVVHAEEFPAGGKIFGLVELPLLPDWLFLGEAEDVHELAAHGWIPLTLIHIAAALWHHFARRDSVLTRMTRD